MFSSEWKHGGWSWYAQGITEGDDAGRPLSGPLDATDRLRLSHAGDSLAVGGGVTPGVGDYDSVRNAFHNQCDGYLVKPLKLNRLEALMSNINLIPKPQ